MLQDNIYTICKNLGIEKEDIDGVLSINDLKINPKKNQIILSELYKAGGKYSTISISDF